jgi:hypothetical protein
MVYAAGSGDLTLSPESKASLLPRNRHTLSQSDRVQSFASITVSFVPLGVHDRL